MLKEVNIGAQRISQLLPHSYPFLLVDKVDSYETNKIICKKNVTLNEPFFQGHFPGNPIVPGVLMIEMAAQSAALMYILDSVDYEHVDEDDVNNFFEDNHLSQMVGYIAAVKGFKFQQIVRPGTTLSIHCQKTHESGLLSEVTVMLYDDSQKMVCKGRILVSKNEN